MRTRPLLVSITMTAGMAHEALYHCQSRLAELRGQMRHLVASAQLQQRQDDERRAGGVAQPAGGGKRRGQASAATASPVAASGAKVKRVVPFCRSAMQSLAREIMSQPSC